MVPWNTFGKQLVLRNSVFVAVSRLDVQAYCQMLYADGLGRPVISGFPVVCNEQGIHCFI